MKPKILISVKGGIVMSVGANQDTDIVIIDYDAFETGDYEPVSEVLSPDYIAENTFHQMWMEGEDNNDEEEKEIKEALEDLDY